MYKKKTLSLNLDDWVFEQIEVYCDYLGLTRTKLLRRLLTEKWTEFLKEEDNYARYNKAIINKRDNIKYINAGKIRADAKNDLFKV